MKPARIPSNNLSPSGMASGSAQSCCDSYSLSSDDEECLLPRIVAKMAPGCSDRAARVLTATRLNSSSPPESPMTCGQVIRI